jgi:hypothetical protein
MVNAVQAVDIKSIMVVKMDVGNPIMNYIHILKWDNIYPSNEISSKTLISSSSTVPLSQAP